MRSRGLKIGTGGTKRDSRNVVNWLNQVGFLKVSQPSSLIPGLLEASEGPWERRTGVMKGNKICGGSVLIVARSYAIMPHAAMGLPRFRSKKTGLGPTVANFRLEGIRSSQLDY